MELKTKYQYTYFIYPYVIKESRYLKYLLRLLKDKNCKLRTFKKDKDFLYKAQHWDHWASWTFASALGEMRGTFGNMIAQIAAAYGLDVEDELASIIPDSEHDDEVEKA